MVLNRWLCAVMLVLLLISLTFAGESTTQTLTDKQTDAAVQQGTPTNKNDPTRLKIVNETDYIESVYNVTKSPFETTSYSKHLKVGNSGISHANDSTVVNTSVTFESDMVTHESDTLKNKSNEDKYVQHVLSIYNDSMKDVYVNSQLDGTHNTNTVLENSHNKSQDIRASTKSTFPIRNDSMVSGNLHELLNNSSRDKLNTNDVPGVGPLNSNHLKDSLHGHESYNVHSDHAHAIHDEKNHKLHFRHHHLQLVPADDEPFGSMILKDERYLVSVIIPVGVGILGASVIVVTLYTLRYIARKQGREFPLTDDDHEGERRSYISSISSERTDKIVLLGGDEDDEF